MYVTAISPRLSRGRSTPATRAITVLLPTLLRLASAVERPAASHSHQPCRCLCRGFLQMIRVTPWRFTILQCSHRTLTDGRTFIVSLEPFHRLAKPSLEPVRDAAPRQVVR